MQILNEMQQEAVMHTEGPLLILAGAGSGKTRVLTHRISHLIDDCHVDPFHILAITFTNKAAGEMRERVDKMTGEAGARVWVSTFHSMCVRILRRYIDRLGYDKDFTIYDADDQKVMVRGILKDLMVDTKTAKERGFLQIISSAKNDFITSEMYASDARGFQIEASRVYKRYEQKLRANNALDFDDLLLKTVELLRDNEDVATYYQDRFQYIMVDEYQDTNTVQFELVRLLAGSRKNLCVVGDDDQSIYKFRGANIKNILNFEKVYNGAKVIRLEQNYRSTKTILKGANSVIKNNLERKQKTLWSDKEEGEKIRFAQLDTHYDEAEYIVNSIVSSAKRGKRSYRDYAILYRTNAQSRVFEEKLMLYNVPYKIVGGVHFFSRREIKDLLAYLRILNNTKDDLSVRRIINVPKRGIGLTTLNKIGDYADEEGLDFYQALLRIEEIQGISGRAVKIRSFTELIEDLKKKAEGMRISELFQAVLTETDYVNQMDFDTEEEGISRKENIDELYNTIVEFENNAEDDNPTLNDFLASISLASDMDSLEEDSEYVVLMTLHSAKGLEFPVVYMGGMEDGLFPSFMATQGESDDLEEERRLCYVGMTRAMEELIMTSAKSRMKHGERQWQQMSRFMKEIPKDILVLPFGRIDKEEPKGNDAYQHARKSFHQNAYKEIKQYPVKNSSALDYEVGDRVSHSKMGEGVVKQIVQGGRDYEVTVDFDSAGVRKMFAAFAKLIKL